MVSVPMKMSVVSVGKLLVLIVFSTIKVVDSTSCFCWRRVVPFRNEFSRRIVMTYGVDSRLRIEIDVHDKYPLVLKCNRVPFDLHVSARDNTDKLRVRQTYSSERA